MNISEKHSIILFDGDCGVCNKSVQFIVKRDKHQHFKFAALTSNIGKELLAKHQLSNDFKSSIVVITYNACFIKSEAALFIVKRLSGLWRFFCIFKYTPKSMRDFCYDWVARNRYRFIKSNSCEMPSEQLKKALLQ